MPKSSRPDLDAARRAASGRPVDRGVRRLHRDALRDLDLEVAVRDAVRIQLLDHRAGKPGVGQVARGHVDRDVAERLAANRVCHSLASLHGVGHHLLVDRDRAARSPRRRRGSIRLEQARLGVADPNERLAPRRSRRVARSRIGWYSTTMPFLVDRPQQHPLGAQPPDRPGAQLLVEHVGAVCARVLRAIEREVGFLEQVVGAASESVAHAIPTLGVQMTPRRRTRSGSRPASTTLLPSSMAASSLSTPSASDHELVTAQTGKLSAGRR